MLGADAGADEKLERREVGEEIGVKLEHGHVDDGSDGGMTGEGVREWSRRGVVSGENREVTTQKLVHEIKCWWPLNEDEWRFRH